MHLIFGLLFLLFIINLSLPTNQLHWNLGVSTQSTAIYWCVGNRDKIKGLSDFNRFFLISFFIKKSWLINSFILKYIIEYSFVPQFSIKVIAWIVQELKNLEFTFICYGCV